MIILNSPSNPSGAVMSPEDLTEVVQLAARARHLGALRRVLRLSELHRRAVFGGIVARISRAHGDRRLAVEDLCHDRLAAGLCAGSGAGDRGHAEAAEPVHFESDVDRAEGGGRGSERPAGVRGRDAPRIHPAARPRGQRACARFRACNARCRKARSMPIRIFRPSSGAAASISLRVAGRLLREAHVATVPGEGFGTREHIRVSYATSVTELDRGLERMRKFLAAL